jgi:hypothetical protein
MNTSSPILPVSSYMICTALILLYVIVWWAKEYACTSIIYWDIEVLDCASLPQLFRILAPRSVRQGDLIDNLLECLLEIWIVYLALIKKKKWIYSNIYCTKTHGYWLYSGLFKHPTNYPKCFCHSLWTNHCGSDSACLTPRPKFGQELCGLAIWGTVLTVIS